MSDESGWDFDGANAISRGLGHDNTYLEGTYQSAVQEAWASGGRVAVRVISKERKAPIAKIVATPLGPLWVGAGERVRTAITRRRKEPVAQDAILFDHPLCERGDEIPHEARALVARYFTTGKTQVLAV